MFENIGHWLESSSRSGCNRGAAVEADTIGEQQLKRTQSESSSSAQRPVRRRITHVGERGVAEQAKRVKLLVYIIYVAQYFPYQKCN